MIHWSRLKTLAGSILALSSVVHNVHAEHHMRSHVEPRQGSGSSQQLELVVANWCSDTIWPGIVTQAGTGPGINGWALSPGDNKTITVSGDWQGRVWARTNCTFNDPEKAGDCTTGECGSLNCKQAGNPPATLAEFTMDGGQDQTFYDISLVDGYNMPMAIVLVPGDVKALKGFKGSSTNPSCVGSVGNLAPQSFNPYGNNQVFLGTNSSDPLEFEKKQSSSSVAQWCPWDLQVSPPKAPGNGVYPYPDGNVPRPAFDPCLSACAKYNTPQYCCTGQYDGSGKCSPNYYANAAKDVCPDAYSYAYDDQDSTFIVPKGGEFEIIFCPGGRSTTIIQSHQKASGAPTKRSILFSTYGGVSRRSAKDGAAWERAYIAFWLIVLVSWVA